MDPKDFLYTAGLLSNSGKESDLRTSISRSYYAVLLFFRNYFANQLKFPPENLGSGVHKFVPECFSESESPNIKKMGAKINRMKGDRNKADYRLSEDISSQNAKDSLQSAKELISTTISNPIKKEILGQARARAKVRRLIR